MTDTPWLALDPGEEIVWSGGPRLHVILWVAVPALAVPVLVMLALQSVAATVLGTLMWIGITGIAYLFVTNVEYVVSTKYVYSKWGILGRTVTQIAHRNIQDTTIKQGVFGTHAGYGTVGFSTAGGDGTTLSFHVIDDPKRAKSTVDQQLASGRSRVRKDETTASIDELVESFRATRRAAERIAGSSQP